MSWAAIGALAGAVLGFVFAWALNTYILGLVDWAQQDFLSGGIASPFMIGGIGAVAGFFLGLIIKLSR